MCKKAIADIDSARALYGQTNASLFPTVNAALSSTRSRSLANGTGTTAEADGTVSSYTLDLFGRNQSLSRAAGNLGLASEFTAQNTRLTLIAEISTARLTLAADNSNRPRKRNDGQCRKLIENYPAPATGWHGGSDRCQ